MRGAHLRLKVADFQQPRSVMSAYAAQRSGADSHRRPQLVLCNKRILKRADWEAFSPGCCFPDITCRDGEHGVMGRCRAEMRVASAKAYKLKAQNASIIEYDRNDLNSDMSAGDNRCHQQF